MIVLVFVTTTRGQEVPEEEEEQQQKKSAAVARFLGGDRGVRSRIWNEINHKEFFCPITTTDVDGLSFLVKVNTRQERKKSIPMKMNIAIIVSTSPVVEHHFHI